MPAPEDYEALYRDALTALRLSGCIVGRKFTENQARLCVISGFPRNDWEVFQMAWGEERADEILGFVKPAAPASAPGLRTEPELFAELMDTRVVYVEAMRNYRNGAGLFSRLLKKPGWV